jgi:cytoskeletal protein CcmA (bactofilin family)
MSLLRAVKSLWAPAPPPAKQPVHEVMFVHEGAEMHGVIQAAPGSTVMVQGTQRGDIAGARIVFVAASGVVDGSVYADEVIVAGEVIGEVHASRRAEVHSSGTIIGTIHTKAALFLEGARVNGSLRIGSNVKVELGSKPSAMGVQLTAITKPAAAVPPTGGQVVSATPAAVRLDPVVPPVTLPLPPVVTPLQVGSPSGEAEVVVQKSYRISL